MQEIYYPSKNGKNTIHACVWRPDGEIKGVVQIIHGMAEYAARYSPFAEFLVKNGYLVCAEDHLGHGLSVDNESGLGYFNDEHDFRIILADIRELHLKIKEEVAGKPYVVLGHSMGSFFCRNYIATYGNELAAAIVMGSGFKSDATLNTALRLVKMNASSKGWRYRSNFIKKLAFGSYNKKFGKAANSDAWLSVSEQNINNYKDDKLCGFDFTNNGYYVLFSVIKQACASSTISSVPKDLPVLFVAGADDPVGDYGKGVKKAAEKFRKAGVKGVEVKLYENARHEILNDHCRDEVFADILVFINKHTDIK